MDCFKTAKEIEEIWAIKGNQNGSRQNKIQWIKPYK